MELPQRTLGPSPRDEYVISGQYIYEASLTAPGPWIRFQCPSKSLCSPPDAWWGSGSDVSAFQVPWAHAQALVQGPRAAPSRITQNDEHTEAETSKLCKVKGGQAQLRNSVFFPTCSVKKTYTSMSLGLDYIAAIKYSLLSNFISLYRDTGFLLIRSLQLKYRPIQNCRQPEN